MRILPGRYCHIRDSRSDGTLVTGRIAIFDGRFLWYQDIGYPYSDGLLFAYGLYSFAQYDYETEEEELIQVFRGIEMFMNPNTNKDKKERGQAWV